MAKSQEIKRIFLIIHYKPIQRYTNELKTIKQLINRNMLEELMKYFETTPHEKIMEDWAKSEEFDQIEPTISDFLIQTKDKPLNNLSGLK